MSYKNQRKKNDDVKLKEGASLPQEAKTKPSINNLLPLPQNLNDILQERIRFIKKGYQTGYNIILHEVKTKKPNWLGMKASDYKADLQRLLDEYIKKPLGYGYGVVVGPQLDENLNVISIDIDIDTKECKERISKEFEELLNKHGIKYYKETTKTERIHYYIILDKTTDKIESISKLPYPGNCFKLKDGKEIPGEVELFTKKNKSIIVYNGILNDKEPFFTQKPVINNHKTFETFLEEWMSKYKPVESIKEST